MASKKNDNGAGKIVAAFAFLLLLFAISGKCQSTRERIVTEGGAEKLTIVAEMKEIPNGLIMQMTWSETKCVIRVIGSMDAEPRGVHLIQRGCPEGEVAFGIGKIILAAGIQRGVKVKIDGKVDFSKPYIMREERDHTTIFQEDPQNIEKIFAEQNYYFRQFECLKTLGLPLMITIPKQGSAKIGLNFEVKPNWWWLIGGEEKLVG